MTRRASIALCALIACPAAASAQAGATIQFTPTAGVPTFAVREPVLRIAPGAIVETRTFSRPGDYYEGGAWPGEVGPFHIEGAAPGDTLVVRILRLRPNRDIAMSRYSPGGISGVAGDSRTRMLNDPLPARQFVWKLDRDKMTGTLDLPEFRLEDDYGRPQADARTRRGRAGGPGGIRRAMARRLRRQSRRVGCPRGRHRLPAGVS